MFPGYIDGEQWSETGKLEIQLNPNSNPAGNYLLNVNNKNTATRCEICLS